jgi:hypothetical protein
MIPEHTPDYNTFDIHLNIIDKKKMKELNLDITDLLIVRWFYNWYTYHKMLKEIEGGVPYYWVNYSAVVREFDIAGITSVSGARRRLLRLCGEEGNDIATPLLKRITRNYKAYSSQVFFHLDEALFFSIVSYGHIGSGVLPLEIEEELGTTQQDKAIEVPVEALANLITPETIAFIDKGLSFNSQFSKPRINLTEPSKALMNIQTYREELLDGTFVQKHQNQLPSNLRSVVLPSLTEDDILSRMAGVKLANKIGIGDYFLSYNHNTKSYSSMFISYMSKATKDNAPAPAPKAVVTEVKTSGMHPKAIVYMSDGQKEAHRKLGVTDMNTVARVADIVYTWYDSYPNIVKTWYEQNTGKKLMYNMKNFMEAWKERVGKTADEFYKNVVPFDTNNYQWLLFARYMWKHSNVLLHNKLSCAIIQSNDGAWYWVDYNSLRKDIG